MDSDALIDAALSRIAVSSMTSDSLRYELRMIYEAGISSAVDNPKNVVHTFDTDEEAKAFRNAAMTAYHIWRFNSGKIKGQHVSHDSKLL